ncbi:MAG: hypothetical protein LBP33_04690, partial [Candidatus Adiutrix sp.]|nr:hypothetical protein [Candidatus Adiutrix sp.]
MPRILSLAAERAKDWFYHPDKCPQLQTSPDRRTRSERREACQVVLEALLSRLDLTSLCVGVPTPANGFIDMDMKSIVQLTGLGQRRCERAIGQLKQAGFITVKQPRLKNGEGRYVGLRAVRVITKDFFDWLGLGPMLAKERARAGAALKRKARAAGKSLSDLMERVGQLFHKKGLDDRPKPKAMDLETVRAWNRLLGDYFKQGLDTKEAQRLVNEKFGFPPSWSPGQGAP